MAFNKANPEVAAALLANRPGTKGYKHPLKGKKRKKKPGPRTMQRYVPLKKGILTNEEQIAIKVFAASVEPGETDQQLAHRSKALGIALRRSPKAIHDNVMAALEDFKNDAPEYFRLLKKAAAVASAKGDSKPVEWALEHITTMDDKGKEKPLFKPAKSQDKGSSMPIVNIGVMLGGIAPGASLTNIPTVEVIDSEDIEP